MFNLALEFHWPLDSMLDMPMSELVKWSLMLNEYLQKKAEAEKQAAAQNRARSRRR